MRRREVLILVLVGAMLGGCALVDDEPGQIAGAPSTSISEELDRRADGSPDRDGAGADPVADPSAPVTAPTSAGPAPSSAVPAPSATGSTSSLVPPTTAAEAGSQVTASPEAQAGGLPPVCVDMAKFMIQSAEVLRVPTTAEALEWLRSLRATVKSLETTGGTDLGGSARALGAGIDRAVDMLDPTAPIDQTHQAILTLSGGVAEDTDRLVTEGVGRCGGTGGAPILSAQEGIRLLTGSG